MPRSIEITFDFGPNPPDVHRIRNFGEDLYRVFRDIGLASLDIADVDRATDRIVVRAASSATARRALKIVEEQARRHFPEGAAIVIAN